MADIKETYDGLKEIADSKNDSVCEKLKCVKIAKDALEVIGEAYRTIGNCYSKIDELIEKEWIPVSERLPDAYEPVLVYGKECGIEIMQLEDNGEIDSEVHWEWHNGHDYFMRIENTVWMPLPDPPKDGEQE